MDEQTDRHTLIGYVDMWLCMTSGDVFITGVASKQKAQRLNLTKKVFDLYLCVPQQFFCD